MMDPGDIRTSDNLDTSSNSPALTAGGVAYHNIRNKNSFLRSDFFSGGILVYPH